MKKTLLALAIMMAAGTPALAANAPQPMQPRILLIDRQAILRMSKVGQDVAKQVQTYADQAKADIAGQQKALQTEAQQLQQQVAILAADARQKKVQAFEAKQAGMQAAAQRREASIQGGFMNAQATIARTLEPILQTLMQQRGANMILDKNALVYASPDAVKALDITQSAVDMLNQKLPNLKVTLATAPAPAKK
jgi:Skp family chaperone for outer membrane proteins